MSDMKLPEFYIAPNIFAIPSLIVTSLVIAKEVKQELVSYSGKYSRTLKHHPLGETEIHLEGGHVSKCSELTLLQLEGEFEILQYREKISSILLAWGTRITGNPVYPAVHNIILEVFEDVMDKIGKNLIN